MGQSVALEDVVDGMTEIYQRWVDFGIDGFRIDTVKHVNMEFWQKSVSYTHLTLPTICSV